MTATWVQTCSISAEQMARQEHGRAVGGQLADQVPDLAGALGVHPVRRLIEHEQQPGAQQRGRQAQPLAHPEAVRAIPLVGRRRQPDPFEGGADPRSTMRRWLSRSGGSSRSRFCRPVSHG